MKKSIFFKTNENPDVRWVDIENKECLYFYFRGIFKQEDAVFVKEKCEELTSVIPNRKNILVCNFLDIKNYETNARNVLQSAINEHKDIIGDVIVITKSPIIYAAIEIVSFFTSLNIKVVDSVERLQDYLRDSA